MLHIGPKFLMIYLLFPQHTSDLIWQKPSQRKYTIDSIFLRSVIGYWDKFKPKILLPISR